MAGLPSLLTSILENRALDFSSPSLFAIVEFLILKYIAGLPNPDIAKIMNKQEGTIRGLQMRALQVLAKYMHHEEIV